jgi:ADP-heptose:LPS heptosyltransferase
MRMQLKMAVDYYVGGCLHVCLKPFVMLLGQLLHRNHDLDRVRQVTILKLLGGGSLIIAYPSLIALKRSGRFKRLRLVTTPGVEPFARLTGLFDEIILVDDRKTGAFIWSASMACFRLFRTDAIIDLEIHSRLSVVFAALTCARNRVGFYTATSFWRQGLCTHLLYLNPAAGIYDFYDQLCNLWNCVPADFLTCQNFMARACGVAPWCQKANVASIDVAIVPCCSDLSNVRMLAVEQWREVVGNFARQEHRKLCIHLIGGPSDRSFCEKLSGRLEEELAGTGARIANRAGELSLKESVCVVTQCELLFSIDTGMLHIARLLGVPLRSYWGPTNPATLLRPWTEVREITYYEHIACSPCVHITYPPPCNGNNICMRRLSAKEPLDKSQLVWLRR